MTDRSCSTEGASSDAAVIVNAEQEGPAATVGERSHGLHHVADARLVRR